MLNRLKKLGFTKEDLVIIAFLLAAFLGGLIVKSTGWNSKTEFDYSVKDREFDQQLKSAYSELKSTSLSQSQEEKLNRLKSISDSLISEKESNSTLESGIKPDRKININLAYSSDLQILPGVGGITAERIIEYRELNGNFKTIEEIMRVKGIGKKKFDKIKDFITIE